jgi:hypothetical protein
MAVYDDWYSGQWITTFEAARGYGRNRHHVKGRRYRGRAVSAVSGHRRRQRRPFVLTPPSKVCNKAAVCE